MAEDGITVAMATYNGARFLRAQLDSLGAQDLLPSELVVCDDASTDRTVAILRDFAGSAPFPVRIHVNPRNLGWRANFMRAAGLARAPLIAFCDQDDLWYPPKLRTMAALFADPAVLLGYHDADLIDAEGRARGRLRAHDRDPPRLVRLTRPIHWESPLGLTMVFRRSLLDLSPRWPASVDPAKPDMPAAHDQWFFTLAACCGTVAFTPDTLLGYRQHGRNVVGHDPVTRSAAAADLQRVAARLAGEAAMVEAFCGVLEDIACDQQQAFRVEAKAALARCRHLGKRLSLRARLWNQTSLAKRGRTLAALLSDRSYGWRDRWRFGYRDMVRDLQIVFIKAYLSK